MKNRFNINEEGSGQMKKLTWHITTILVAAVLLGCSSRYQSHEDEFYNDMGAYPSSRIPLIKPYELYSKEGEPWSLELFVGLWSPPPDDTLLYNNLLNVEKISIKNDVIMAYSPYVDENISPSMKKYVYHWFAIVPDKDIAEGFFSEDAFLKYIQQFGVPEPDWREPSDVYDEYVETECLDWIPDCK